MKRSRTYALAGIAAASSLLLSACSDDSSGSGGSANGDSGGGSDIECGSGDLNASGSSAQGKAIDAWQSQFAATCADVAINYDASGSGQGIKDFIAGQTDMAGSDSALDEEEATQANDRCESGPAINIPLVISPVAVVYNVGGVEDLTLDAETLSKIFSGEITTWNDPAIAALNEGVELPGTTIATVHRSKDSGTTDNFTKYLDAAGNGAWTYGTGKAWAAPGGQGAPDSAGIVSAVNATDGSISYVDAPDAKANDLKTVKLDSGFGGVEMNDESVGKAVDAAERAGEGNDIKLEINYGLKEEGAYPAVLVTYEITCEKGLDEEKAKNVKSFLSYAASDEGQDVLAETGYSKLPEALLEDVRSAIDAIG
ncbi:phosphate ABC transporter substrate-binding protein PstS [Blastococcus sp. Marseille-P5729]|uniref:phosphate ABC transporter substrate-binding protein PstS n=1 Tax=Blastococcus sp. Marseille-P5729 TaxID=2086582 RepID=UPI000D0F7572|nr:phosphate ABC transporter substrate-binding protein PstS [Blastococcus sp. Marseille-P5729]